MAISKQDLKNNALRSMQKEQEDLEKKEKKKKEANAKKTEENAKKKEQDLVGAKDSYKLNHAEAMKEYDFTPSAQKRKQQTSESVAAKTTPTVSAKAVSSEAEKYVPAAQQRKQATSDKVYENVLKGEAYLQSEGDGLAKGLINRLRSAGGETVENVARVINDNVSPDSYFGRTSQNVIDRNTAGQIGDLADRQIAQAKENTGAFGDFLINTADAGANMASQAILSGVLLPGAPAPIANKIFSGVQGVSAGAQKYVDTREAGGSKAEAWQRGIGSGVVAAVTEGLTGIGKTGVSKIPGVNRVVTHLDELATKNWLTNVLSTGLGEGGEEGFEYALEYASDVIADLIYKGEVEAEFNIAELFQNVASGFVLGAGFGSVSYDPSTKPVETDAPAEQPVSPTEASIAEAENVTPETANEQESTFANAARRIKQLQEDRYFVKVTLKNLEGRDPVTAARDRVVWDEKLERINNEIESIIREVSPEALESNAQVNSTNDVVEPTNDVIESANAGERVEAENENKEEAGTLVPVEDIESEIAKVEQEMQNLEKTTFAENPEQSPLDFYDGQEWRNLKKKKKDLEEQRDFLDAISYRNKNLPFEKDENGRYIMYHGSPLDFDEFDTDRMGGLINFAPEYEPASWYSAAGLRGVLKNDVDRYVIGEDRETLYRRTAEDRDIWKPFARGKQSEDGFSYEILPFKDDGEKVALKTITSDDIDNPDSDYYVRSVSANVGKYAVKADNTLDLDDETRYKQNLALWKKIRDDAYKAVKDNKISTNVFTQVQSIYLGARDEKTFRGFWSVTKREYASHAFKDFIVPELKKYGFDSIYHKDDGHKTLVVFEPEQASQIAKRYFWGNGEFVPTKANNATNAQVNSTDDAIEPANDVVEQANAQPRAQGDGGFGANTVGAAQSNSTSYAHLQNEHGVFEPGEQPAIRDPNVPKKDAQGERNSQAVRTFMEAPVTTDELIPVFEKEVAAGTFANRGTTNKETVDKAAQKIASYKTLDEAVNDFRKVYSDDKILSKDDLVFGEILYSMTAEAGANDTAIELASMLVSNNSRTGDAMQAQRILKRLSPEGRLYHAQQIAGKFNKDKHQKNEIKLSEETIKKVLDAKTDEEIEAANDAVAEDIAKQIDKGLFEDIAGIVNAWRYFSMLGNPKTHIRNFFGNVAFLPARKVKNFVKAGIENVAYKANWIDEKTASVKLASKENREFAKESFKKNKKSLLSGGNYRFESEIDSKIEPFRFSGKETAAKKFFNAVLTPARKAAEFNSKALEAEDVLFLKNAYIDSFTQYLTANKIDARNITPAQKVKAENYAAQEAQKATYRDYSAISSALEKLANTTIPIGKDKKALEIYGIKVKPFKFLTEANIPFRKTPINVLSRGIEYSPVGLAKAFTIDAVLLKNGDITANEMIDHISSGLTGSGVVALGAALALKGVLTAGEKEDENEQAFDELQGKQNYALNFGDGSYTIDWLSPTAIPLFIGAEAVQAAKEEYGDNPNWKQIAYSLLKNLDTIADPILELSMLDNLNKLLSGNYGKDGSAIAGLMKDSATSYVLQLIPTLSSQIAQTIDGTRRNAYYVDKTDNIPDDWQILVQRAKAKIPGLSKELPAYVDARGRKQEQSDNIGVRIAENFLSPGYYKKKTVTKEDEMLKQLIKETGDTSLVPKGPSQKYVTVDGTNHPLSAKEYEQMSIEKGKKQYDILSQLAANETYTQLDAETKAKAVKGVYEYSGALSKEGVHGYKLPKEWEKAEKAKEDGLAEGTYISLKSAMSDKEKDINKMEYLIADKGTSDKEKVVAMEYLTDINMDKYKKFSNDPKDIINARMIYLEEDAKGTGANARIIDRMIKDSGTTAKEDVAFMENVLNVNMSKYKSATNDSKEQLELYGVVSDDAKKEEDIKALAKKGYSNEEALAKYNVSSGTKKYENGEFKFGNSTKQKAKAEKLKAKGYDPKTIVKAANAVTSIGKYGTSKSYSTCVKMLKAVGITDKKFQQDFWNIYM